MTLDLPIDPASLPTAQQKGVTRSGRVYTKPEVLHAHRRLMWLLREAFHAKADKDKWRGCYGYPNLAYVRQADRAWRCSIAFVYPTGHRPHRFEGMPKTTRPDVDNLAKLVLDAVTDACIAWPDDGQVAELSLVKRFSRADEAPHIEIQLEPKE